MRPTHSGDAEFSVDRGREALLRIVMEDVGMDSRRLDQITRTFASGMTRRRAMKGVAVALGLSAIGALRAPAAARGSYTLTEYRCYNGDKTWIYRCSTEPTATVKYKGETCDTQVFIADGYSSKKACCSNNGTSYSC
jgi:hypothetical protein